MKTHLSRREFIKKAAVAGAVTVIGGGTPSLSGTEKSNKMSKTLSVVTGKDLVKATKKAIENLGGIQKFVKQGDTVGLLINSAFKHPGTYTHPDLVFAIAELLKEAGASEIWCLKDESGSYFSRSSRYSEFKELLKIIKKKGGGHKTTAIPNGKFLKEGEIIPGLLNCDVFINIPIIKDHSGTRFTGCLKNMMGTATHNTCRIFHFGSNSGGGSWYNDVSYLSQCVVDINTLRKPDLCIADASQFVTTNGPWGPGEMKTVDKIIAGIDPVQVDAYGATLLGLKPENVDMIRLAHDQKLGVYSLTGVVKEDAV